MRNMIDFNPRLVREASWGSDGSSEDTLWVGVLTFGRDL